MVANCLEQQLPIDAVKIALDVNIEHPVEPPAALSGLLEGVDRRSAGAVSIGVIVDVNRQAIGTPDRHRKGTPYRPWDRLVPVANRRAPRATRSALTSDGAARVGGACLPTGASRGGTHARCLNRQLSLPVSMISQ